MISHEQDHSIWHQEETASPRNHKTFKRAMLYAQAIVRRVHALQDTTPENRRGLRALDTIAEGIKDASGVKFVNPLELLMDNRNGPSLKKVSLLATDDKTDGRSRTCLDEREVMRQEI